MKKIIIAVLIFAVLIPLANAASRKVAYNVSNSKYHDLSCTWAKRCTRNCIIIEETDAISRGGIPCKVCGG